MDGNALARYVVKKSSEKGGNILIKSLMGDWSARQKNKEENGRETERTEKMEGIEWFDWDKKRGGCQWIGTSIFDKK